MHRDFKQVLRTCSNQQNTTHRDFEQVLRFKICDPIHGFIRFNAIEKEVIDSAPFQRLRHIRQMGTAYLVYPGATHSRFEHSLGVMELASKMFDTLLDPNNRFIELALSAQEISYWRQIVRLAALCHDLGHLPFSHTAERSLLPSGGHERMTEKIIHNPLLQTLWKRLAPTAEDDVIKLCVAGSPHSSLPWQKVLSQIITDDNFGADRIDYLIRDAYYTGVGYGHFDFHQLLDTLRILPSLESADEFALGIMADGIQSVESLWIARYLMYARVYHHAKSRVYTNHMQRFMSSYYLQHGFPSTWEGYLEQTDFKILNAMACEKHRDEDAACLLKIKGPFIEAPSESISEKKLRSLKEDLVAVFGRIIFFDDLPPKPGGRNFPVLSQKAHVVPSTQESQFLRDIPLGVKPLRLYAHPDHLKEVIEWLDIRIGGSSESERESGLEKELKP